MNGATATLVWEYEASLRLPLGVRRGSAGRVRRPSALPSIAGVLLHCREQRVGAKCGRSPLEPMPASLIVPESTGAESHLRSSLELATRFQMYSRLIGY
jgi:hypothetical protein